MNMGKGRKEGEGGKEEKQITPKIHSNHRRSNVDEYINKMTIIITNNSVGHNIIVRIVLDIIITVIIVIKMVIYNSD